MGTKEGVPVVDKEHVPAADPVETADLIEGGPVSERRHDRRPETSEQWKLERLARAAGISCVLERPVTPQDILRPAAEVVRLTPPGGRVANAARAFP
jgi:hypothetical protein